MDRIARLPARDRQDIFAEAAAQLGIRPTIIEKDFWVCFVLKLLFVKSSLAVPRLQGGTSLSKVHGLTSDSPKTLILFWTGSSWGSVKASKTQCELCLQLGARQVQQGDE